MVRKAGLILLGLVLGSAEIWLGWSILPDNFLGGYLIFIGLGYCIGGGFFLALSRTSASRAESARSNRSLTALAPGALLILLAMPLEYLFLPVLLPRGVTLQWIGLGIILLGVLLRFWTRHTLKKAYQGNLQIQPGQQVIQTGPYRWIRHPGYAGFALQALGLAIGFSSTAGLLGCACLLPALRYRMIVEEQMLVQAFGAEYQDYARRTKRMVPGLW
jgi:protein-S-isoprenylcysteine O-methyltransferase Ste14